jgi:nitrogen fixation protein NifU and related proteins
MDMYMEEILDHYRNPRNFGEVAGANLQVRDTNPLCGDEVSFTAKISGEKLEEVKFKAEGCAISIASSSLLLENLDGKNLQDVIKMTNDELIDLLGIEIGPSRIKCALLGLMTLKKGLIEYIQENDRT